MKGILVLLALLGLISAASAGYVLSSNWHGQDILNNFNFYSGSDPTHGYVYYANQQQASSWGYTYVTNGQLTIRSDDTSVSSGSGRGSVRLESKNVYQRGLFIFDVQHMPFGCGTWPAIWTANLDTWPNGGEIDILEGVNNVVGNQVTLHTGPGCTFPTAQWDETGQPLTGDCGAQGGTVGCSVKDNNPNSYGQTFNNQGGGVFAMQWEASGIYIWVFPRGSIPSDITNNQANPANWGTPRATFPFNQGCTPSFFYNHHIIIDNTFCGDWAGATFGSQCGGDCPSFVQNNPGSFSQAYWVFNYVQVYQ